MYIIVSRMKVPHAIQGGYSKEKLYVTERSWVVEDDLVSNSEKERIEELETVQVGVTV